MAEHKITIRDNNGKIQVDPDHKRVHFNDTVCWINDYSENCEIQNIPPGLFNGNPGVIPVNKGKSSSPALVISDPHGPGGNTYSYFCVDTGSGQRIDPVIIVEPPVGGPADDGQKHKKP